MHVIGKIHSAMHVIGFQGTEKLTPCSVKEYIFLKLLNSFCLSEAKTNPFGIPIASYTPVRNHN